MKQARVPTEQEFRRLVAVVSQGKYGPRNRIALMLSYLAGLRVGEIASLCWSDLLDGEGKVREQLRLSAAVTKGGHARVVFMNTRLRKEVELYRSSLERCPIGLNRLGFESGVDVIRYPAFPGGEPDALSPVSGSA